MNKGDSMNYQKLPDKDKLKIIEHKVYGAYTIIKIVTDALEFRTYDEINDNHSDCTELLRKAQSNLHQIRHMF